MFRQVMVCGVSALCLAVGTSQSFAAAFQNGGFESSPIGALPASGPGWNLVQGNGNVVTGLYCCGLTGAGEGVNYVALSGGGDFLSTIAQTFSTVPGDTYGYSFLLNGANGGEQLVAAISDSASPLTPIDQHSLTVNSGTWISHSYQFTATGTSSIISFTDMHPNGSSDAAIDGVAITFISPEPGSCVLFALGAVGLLVAARRRRKA